jgi:hypothetical protein
MVKVPHMVLISQQHKDQNLQDASGDAYNTKYFWFGSYSQYNIRGEHVELLFQGVPQTSATDWASHMSKCSM